MASSMVAFIQGPTNTNGQVLTPDGEVEGSVIVGAVYSGAVKMFRMSR